MDSTFTPALNSLTAMINRVPKSNFHSPTSRRALLEAARKLSYALETPEDTFQRIAFLPLQATAIRIAIDLDLFEILEKAGSSGKSLLELVEDTGADSQLLIRFMRYLVAIDVFDQVDTDHYTATSISKTFSSSGKRAGMKHYFDLVTQAFIALPEYLAKTKYQNPTDASNGPFQYAYGTDLGAFMWIMQPERSNLLENFNTYLRDFHAETPGWLDWYPITEQVIKGLNIDDGAVTVVDVGGGMGNELLALKKKFPDLPGRLILQDQSENIKNVSDTTVFEPTVHDFFIPQPVKGARVYYFRMVLHDWPDDKARKILECTIPAMRKGYSKILLHEMVIPEAGGGLRELQSDLTMLACLSAAERTGQQWRNLLTSVGLDFKIWTHLDSMASIIEAHCV